MQYRERANDTHTEDIMRHIEEGFATVYNETVYAEADSMVYAEADSTVYAHDGSMVHAEAGSVVYAEAGSTVTRVLGF